MNYKLPFLILLLAFLGAIFAAIFAGAAGNYKKKNLLTENEREFFLRLKRALPEFEIFPQVAMGAILAPVVKPGHRRYYQIRGTFSQKIVDFLICEGGSLNPVAIIELDDRTHDPDRDRRRDAMLQEAGYTIIRWNSRRKPSEIEIRKAIQSLSTGDQRL